MRLPKNLAKCSKISPPHALSFALHKGDTVSEAHTQQAQLDWDAQGQPISRQFDDVYFSKENGLAETHHVFLEGNQLSQRFAELSSHQRFVIGETGFGTGLNFLCAWRLFEQQAPSEAKLHFISVEKYPLSLDDLQRALSLWPELKNWADALVQQYHAIHLGMQQLVFAQGRVTLNLLIGDALDMLPQLEARVEAWFLDGFAPAKNPQMWNPNLFRELARLSAPQATLGTFTSAGFVRRGLIEVGFQMQRVPGYGHKREILRGVFNPTIPTSYKQAPWYSYPTPTSTERKALIIGAGLAGSATAYSLAIRGWKVKILDRNPEAAQEGSGNPQGVLYLKLSSHHTPLSQLVLSGFGYTRRLLQQLPQGTDWSACGVLQLAFDEHEYQQQQKLLTAFPKELLHALNQAEAETYSGVPLEMGGLLFPEAGWLHPPALCRWLLSHPNIQFKPNQEVTDLQRVGKYWRALSYGTLIEEAPIAILTCATDSLNFIPGAKPPLKNIRGQITQLAATADSRKLNTVLCAGGYVAPVRQETHTLGASFALKATDLELSTEEHQSNLALLQEISPQLHQELQAEQQPLDQLQGRAAYRCTSPDYLPLVGPIADADLSAQLYAKLRQDARLRPNTPCPWIEGLYLNTAHGSRGLITAPLAGELLAAWLEHEPLPLPRRIAEACHPNRFWLRRIIRGQ
ncbi:tRNA 5-methylaminomethyl-2-thiouridine biosynthesis bifunctional protein [Azomonas agilis]|uniref:tRNA 5-methylaminomethyl-2-thiouridine biosynthesis bifunctional protein MnmC n=1 Tax=Azomonas agilis TaxID=116849 RepID=A0A562I1P7_9GAMM|nr:tRNA 5-methylaminomethyl-2-thiouridine biosynthesis bifunctional protein [Azomonas agilis]